MTFKRLNHKLPSVVWTSALLLGGTQFVGACGSDTTPSTRGPSRILTATGGTSGKGAGTAGTTAAGTGGAGGHGGSKTNGGTGGSIGTGGGVETGGTKTNGGRSNQGGSGGSQPITEAGAGQGGESGEGGVLETGGTGAVGGGNGGTGGGSCDQSVTTLASVPEAWALAVDAGYVYFTSNQTAGSVARVPVTGGDVETVASNELYPHEVAAANGLLFWAALDTEAGDLVQATTSGSNRHELITEPPSTAGEPGATSGILFVAADATNVYYSANFNDIHARSIATGSDVELTEGPYDSLIVDVALHGSNVYWTNNGVSAFQTPEAQTAVVARSAADGSTAAVSLESRLDYPQYQIAVDDNYVYWSDESAIYRTSHDGGSDFQTLVTLPPAPPDESPIVDMISDGSALFFTDGVSIYRVPVAGGTPTLVTTGWTSIERLALTDSNLVFTDSKRGVVASVAKCAGTTTVTFGTGGAGGQGAGGAQNQGGTGGVSSAQGGAGQGGAVAAGAGGTNAQGGVAGSAGASDCGGHGCPAAVSVGTVPNANGLAIDGSYLYASEHMSAGDIVRIPLAGGDPEPIVTNQTKPFDIAVDADNVYFILDDTAQNYQPGPEHLVYAPKTGGAAQPLVTGIGNGGTGRVTSDGTFVYYVTGYNSVYRLGKNAGYPAVVSAGTYGSVVVDLAVDGTDAYWVNEGTYNSTYTAFLPNTAYVGAAPVSGRADLGHHGLDTGMNGLQRVAVDATNVYFVDRTSVYRHSRAGGPNVVLGAIPTANATIVDMLADGGYVYFADAKGVYRIPAAGGSLETLTYGWTQIQSIITDATSVYFTDSTVGAVMKQTK